MFIKLKLILRAESAPLQFNILFATDYNNTTKTRRYPRPARPITIARYGYNIIYDTNDTINNIDIYT